MNTLNTGMLGSVAFLGTGLLALTTNADFTTATVVAGVVTTVVMAVLQYIREGRTHRWMVEQNQLDRQERIEIAARLQLHHDITAQQVKANTTAGVKELVKKIDENTAMNSEALQVANGVNDKILAIGGLRVGDIAQSAERAKAQTRQTDRIEHTVQDTNKVVHELEEKKG